MVFEFCLVLQNYSYVSNKRSPTIILFWEKSSDSMQLLKTLRLFIFEKIWLKLLTKLKKLRHLLNFKTENGIFFNSEIVCLFCTEIGTYVAVF